MSRVKSFFLAQPNSWRAKSRERWRRGRRKRNYAGPAKGGRKGGGGGVQLGLYRNVSLNDGKEGSQIVNLDTKEERSSQEGKKKDGPWPGELEARTNARPKRDGKSLATYSPVMKTAAGETQRLGK